MAVSLATKDHTGNESGATVLNDSVSDSTIIEDQLNILGVAAPFDTGTLTSGAATTGTDTAKSWGVNSLALMSVIVKRAAATIRTESIISNTADTFTTATGTIMALGDTYSIYTTALVSPASDVTFTPAGGIIATDVQAMGEELDAEIIALEAVLAVAGRVIQTLEATPYTTYLATSNNIPWDNTTPQSSEGTQILSQAITKTVGTRVRVTATIPSMFTTANALGLMTLFKDAIAGALDASVIQYDLANVAIGHGVLVYEAALAAGTTTFKINVGASNGTAYVNGNNTSQQLNGILAARLTVEEIL